MFHTVAYSQNIQFSIKINLNCIHLICLKIALSLFILSLETKPCGFESRIQDLEAES